MLKIFNSNLCSPAQLTCLRKSRLNYRTGFVRVLKTLENP